MWKIWWSLYLQSSPGIISNDASVDRFVHIPVRLFMWHCDFSSGTACTRSPTAVGALACSELLKVSKYLEVLVLPDNSGGYSNWLVNAMFFAEYCLRSEAWLDCSRGLSYQLYLLSNIGHPDVMIMSKWEIQTAVHGLLYAPVLMG